MKTKIKHVYGGIKGMAVMIFTLLLFPFARLFLWRKKIWLISEYGYEARDNGYTLFKYIRLNNPEVNCYYAIDFNSTDYLKIKELGHGICFGSLKHFAYWCGARYIISSKTQGFCPSYYLTLLRKRVHLWGKYIFLQHGITKDDQTFLYKKNAKIDLFICGAKPEYEDIKTRYGYGDKEIAYTGFSRFDNYFDLKTKNQILVMPTWRRYSNKNTFLDSDYYRVWNGFLNSTEINDLLMKHNYKLLFYLHPEFKQYYSLFDSKCSNIKVLSFENTDIQRLIIESKIYITDFSSLAFDFGYIGRPLIYYQYDENVFFKDHYKKGYFDYRRDGFGPVCNDFESLFVELKNILDSNLNIEEKYIKNAIRFFPLKDNQNSKRIFEAIKAI